MVEALPGYVRPACFIGRHLLDVVTAGMYNDPLMLYREYIQNSVDALDAAYVAGLLQPAQGRIALTISGKDRSVTIEDNGVGVPPQHVESSLISIGSSTKDGDSARGFRGIGRLGGLAYCDLLRFETRAAESESVSVVEWDGSALRRMNASERLRLDKAVKAITAIRSRPGEDNESPHFFRVRLHNVRQFHTDALLNIRAVREYLSQVAPVPYNEKAFSHASRLHNYFAQLSGYGCYVVSLNGEGILRPYADEIRLRAHCSECIKGVSLFDLRDSAGGNLGLGWYGITDLIAGIPATTSVRGIRLRQGNIQIGDERIFEGAFSEPRFAMWHVGEIHIANGAIRPNARRDSLEHSPDHEQLLAQVNILGRHLSALCRQASLGRSKEVRTQRLLTAANDVANMGLFIDSAHREQTTKTMLAALRRANNGMDVRKAAKLKAAEAQLLALQASGLTLENALDRRSVSQKRPETILLAICATILSKFDASDSAASLIAEVCAPYLTPRSRARLGVHCSMKRGDQR